MPLSVSDRPFVALTRVHVLPLQAFESLLQLFEARATYEEFCIPMCMVPATISNNVPGTNLSIGADTALNAIVEVREAQINADSRRTRASKSRCAVTSCLTRLKLIQITPVLWLAHTHGSDKGLMNLTLQLLVSSLSELFCGVNSDACAPAAFVFTLLSVPTASDL